MNFETKYIESTYKFSSPTGEKTQLEHTAHIGKDGRRKLIADNPRPIYEMIQAHREECEIERIVKRALNGDVNALSAIEGQYLDLTGAPKSLADAQQIIINAKRDFDKLDAETKKKFDNNVEIFIAEAGSKDWCDKLGLTAKWEAEKAQKEHVAEYEKNVEAAMANLAKGGLTKEEGAEA